MMAIEVSNLIKTFKGRKGVVVEALKGISFNVGQGEVFGFLGPNGAGKSTTIKCLMGLIKLSSGKAAIMGRDISSDEARKMVGYLPENPAFYDYLSAEEYLRFVGRIFKMPEPQLQEKIEEMLKLLELWEARNRPMRSYSKGMVQRVGLAQTLIHDPEVYILDEPMSGLDPIGRALVKEIILDLKKRGKSVFFSTHITDDVEKVCDRVGIIVNGELQAVHAVDDLLRHGIEGYYVQVAGCPDDLASEYGGNISAPDDTLYIPRNLYQIFMEKLFASGGSVVLIEPKRKNLEAFFLDVVATKNQ